MLLNIPQGTEQPDKNHPAPRSRALRLGKLCWVTLCVRDCAGPGRARSLRDQHDDAGFGGQAKSGSTSHKRADVVQFTHP